MKRHDLESRAHCRPRLERLEERALPGDALGGLLAALLGASFSLDSLGAEPAGDPPAGRSGARRLSLAEDRGASSPALVGLEALLRARGDEPAHGHDGPAPPRPAAPAAGGANDSWVDFFRTRPAQRRLAAASPPAAEAAAPAAAGGNALAHAPEGHAPAAPAAAGPTHGHAHDGHAHHEHHHAQQALSAQAGEAGPAVQSAEELAQIAFFTDQYAQYEASHPHGHEPGPAHDHEHGHDDAGHGEAHDAPAPALGPSDGDVGAQNDTLGQWGPVLNWPLVTVHSHMLPTGKVLLWAYSQSPRRIWDPATGQIEPTIPSDPGYNIFCVGHSFLADGRLFVAGGHVQNGWGLPNASIYDPVTDSWTRVPDMNNGRWYPTSTTLPNGDVLVTSGSYDINFTNNSLPQVYQVATNTWRNLTTAQLNLPLYPFMFVAPNGRVFNAGPQQMARYLDTAGTGGWTNVANNTFGYRDYGTAVMYEPGKVLLVGGGGGSDTGPPPSATAEVIDLNATTPAWRRVTPLATGRRQHNATILPDGTVLVTGGSSAPGFNNQAGAVHTAELWSPATETWTTLATSTQYRGYHSTALLLPDGRILSSGGDNHANAEVFSPPYLFKGPRPAVTAAPTAVGYGQSFAVETPDAAGVSKVTLVRLSSVTHAFNENQRFNSLSFTRVAGGLNVTAPANGNLAPPGDYMLFVINGNGVPSVARIVRVGTASVPAAPGNLTAAAASPTRVNLAWQDNSSNETGFTIERRTGTAGAFAVIATAGANATSYQDNGLSPGTQYFYRARATNANGSSAYSNEAGATTPTAVQIVDDRDAGFSTAGNWDTYNGLGHLNDFTYSPTGSGADVASWAFNVTPGQYRLSATWVARPNRASDAPYTILDGTTALATFRANQSLDPNDFADAGTAWEDLGTLNITGPALTVRLSDAANSDYVIADAVRVERIGDVLQGPEIQVLDGTTDIADGGGSVSFGSTVVGAPLSKTFTVRNLGTANLTLGSAITVPAGFTVTSGFGSTSLAPGASTTFTVRLDAAAAGSYSGQLSFTNNDADKSPFNFAIAGTVSSSVPVVQVVDDGGSGFSTSGNWEVYTGSFGHGGDFSYSPSGTGADVATWTFTVTPGTYRVSATWVERPNRATNAPYTILDGGTALTTVRVNQRLAPNDFTSGGTAWEDLATVTISGGSLVVRLTDGADSEYVIADAVRIERVG